MENISKNKSVSARDIAYYRQRNRNRLLEHLHVFFSDEAESTGITKKDIADILDKDPAQITRWLSAPGNLTVDTISDILFAMRAEMDYQIVKFEDRREANFQHPLVGYLLESKAKRQPKKKKVENKRDETGTPAASPTVVKVLELSE